MVWEASTAEARRQVRERHYSLQGKKMPVSGINLEPVEGGHVRVEGTVVGDALAMEGVG